MTTIRAKIITRTLKLFWNNLAEYYTYTLELFLNEFKSVMPLLLPFPITLLQFPMHLHS